VLTSNFIRALAWLALAILVAVTISPLESRPHLGSGEFADLERAAAFLTLGLLYGTAYRHSWPLALGFVVLVALALETAQLLTADRHGEASDAFVKALSGAAGVVIGTAIVELVRRRRARRSTGTHHDRANDPDRFH
jgi:hypothetical protein